MTTALHEIVDENRRLAELCDQLAKQLEYQAAELLHHHKALLCGTQEKRYSVWVPIEALPNLIIPAQKLASAAIGLRHFNNTAGAIQLEGLTV